ncbi:putative exocyst complex component Exo70, cullin repeat-like-containing domain-containing protein [Rosa chinensis]|uniref:Exocyst subunit Exo70 family protein n=1 Tax=Rosa chinensis TaxID=74649 RepID=A0A2P6R069_ROSCH|nr:exocyst complex component EXO70B1 [Rosa chinensis]PRQ39831.1 putative exocyst complex component Exo70, cullin repeat-like-containing domain-containing protein [Rosa chinensis]
MEKNAQAPEKSASFPRQHSGKKNIFSGPTTPKHRYETIDEEETEEKEGGADEDPNVPVMSYDEVLEEVDCFYVLLSESVEEKRDPPKVPGSVERLCKTLDSKIKKFGKGLARFGENEAEDSSFTQAVVRVSKISIKLGDIPSNSATAETLNRTSAVLQRAMAALDEEFRSLLSQEENNNNNNKTDSNPSSEQSRSQKLTAKLSSFNNNNNDSDRKPTEATEPDPLEEFPSFSPESIVAMEKIASTMIASGYENECCMIYSISRRIAFKSALNDLGYENISIDDVQRMQWEALEGEIATWITVVKTCSTILFTGERKLCDAVFACHSSISDNMFCNMARGVVIQLFNFADAVVLTKRSAEKLFKILDMYECLRDLVPAIKSSYAEEVAKDLISEAEAAMNRLGEAAVSIFCDLENSIKSDNGRTPVPSGAVHPLTRYVMNYVKYACEYKDSLEEVFQQNHDTKGSSGNNTPGTTPSWSPFQLQLITVMDMLDANLDMKSKLYRDSALRYIFLMNNGRYIMQKVKGSNEIHQLMGDKWCRKRSTDLRGYHKNYQRDTWSKVLRCLNHEGLQVNGKVSKPVLKERFKSFNAMFDEIHKTQSTWVVSDEQLQSELRVSVSAVMIPAYRSFWGRFKQYLDSGRQTEKYIRYQPEDIENMIDDLFDGNPTSMVRRR